MIIEKIQHYLSLSFLILLIIVQGLIFVITRAEIYPGLEIELLKPASPTIYKGEALNLQAQLIGLSSGALEQLGLEGDITCQELDIQEYSFILKDANENDLIIFSGDSFYDQETCLLESAVTWDTSNYDLADYKIAVQAKIMKIANSSNPDETGFSDICNDPAGCDPGSGMSEDNLFTFESELFNIHLIAPEYQGELNILRENNILTLTINLVDSELVNYPESFDLVIANSTEEYNISLNIVDSSQLIWSQGDIDISSWSAGDYSISTVDNPDYILELEGSLN